MLTSCGTPDKRILILRAAVSLLANYGFHGFSMKQLADRAGVAAGTLYLYFKDRDDLIRQLHQEIIQAFAQHALADHDPDQPLQLQYLSICQKIWEFCRDNPDILMSKGQFDHLPPDILRDHHKDAWEAFEPLRVLFNQCRKKGLVKPLSDEILATLCIDAFLSLARKLHLGLVSEEDLDLQPIIHATWDAIAIRPGH
jgi:TetR/AcrR family transcriptional regulator, multidrug resistance operon repressor